MADLTVSVSLRVSQTAPTVSGTINLPNKFALSANFSAPTVSGSFAVPNRLSFSLTPSFDTPIVSGRLKKPQKVRIKSLLSPYFIPTISANVRSPYGSLIVITAAHGIPYSQRELHFFTPIFKYKLPEILQKSNRDAWEFWRAGNANFKAVNSLFSRLPDPDSFIFNRTTSTYEAAQVLQQSMFSKYWQTLVVEHNRLSHYEAAGVVFKHVVVPADFRRDTVNIAVSHYEAAGVVGNYRTFEYACRKLVDGARSSHYYAVERVGVVHLSPYDFLTKNKACALHDTERICSRPSIFYC